MGLSLNRSGLIALSFLLALLLSGCGQKPIPWVKENTQRLVDKLGFEKDRGSYMEVPDYYQDSNRDESQQAGKRTYLQEIYPDRN